MHFLLSCLCVCSRQKLLETFPAQKPCSPSAASNQLYLPRSTLQQIEAAVEAENWSQLFKLKADFDLAQQMHKKQETAAARP